MRWSLELSLIGKAHWPQFYVFVAFHESSNQKKLQSLIERVACSNDMLNNSLLIETSPLSLGISIARIKKKQGRHFGRNFRDKAVHAAHANVATFLCSKETTCFWTYSIISRRLRSFTYDTVKTEEIRRLSASTLADEAGRRRYMLLENSRSLHRTIWDSNTFRCPVLNLGMTYLDLCFHV